MKKRLQGLIAGILIGAILTSGVVFAKQAAETISVIYDNIKITLNGQEMQPKDANGTYVEPFTYNGTTYLPVRAVANALGIDVDWDDATNTVLLNNYNNNASTHVPELITDSDLTNISYDKSFTLTRYYTSGKLWRITKISSFEITNIEQLSYSDQLKISCKVTGTIHGDVYCGFDAKCYDAEGFVIGTGSIYKNVSEGETFRFTDDFLVPNGTVRIEFVDE